jgi:hypothetical protein
LSIFLDRLLDRRAFLLPTRHQFADTTRIHHGARYDMRSDFFTFFENGNGDIRIQLSKVIGGGKTGWPTAHDQHIDFKDFAFLHSYPEFSRS